MYKYILHHLINVATQFCKTQNLCFFFCDKICHVAHFFDLSDVYLLKLFYLFTYLITYLLQCLGCCKIHVCGHLCDRSIQYFFHS